MAKNKTELFEEESTNFVLSVCNNNFTLKINFLEIEVKLLEMHKKYFKRKKFKNKEITQLVIYGLTKTAKEKLKFMYYWELKEKIKNLIFQAKLEIQTRVDFLDSCYEEDINEVYFEANPGLKEFDNLIKTYFELIRLKNSGLDVNKFLEDTNNQLSSYPNNFYFKSPYFCNLLTEIIVEAGEKKEKNEKNRTC
jgi:hypothetical protein